MQSQKRARVLAPMNLFTGKQEIDEEEGAYLEAQNL